MGLKKHIIFQIASIVLILLAVVYFWMRGDVIFTYIRTIRWEYSALLLLSCTLNFGFLGFAFFQICKLSGIRLRPLEWFGLTICNTMYNYISPFKAGLVAKGMYLKKKYNISVVQYSLLTIKQNIFSIVASLICLFFFTHLYLFLYGWNEGEPFFQTFLFIGYIFIGLCLILVLAFLIFKKTRLYSKLIAYLSRNVMGNIIPPLKVSAIIFVTYVFTLILTAIRFYICSLCFNFDINIPGLLISASAINLSFMISLTPGNFGIKEGIAGLFGALMNISFDQAVAISLLDRAFGMVSVFF